MSSIRFNPQSAPQGLYDVSADQLAPLGATLVLGDDREFVYAEAGAVALTNGRLCQSALPIANHANRALDAPAIGTRVVNVTPGATAGAENLYAEGYLVIVNDTGDITEAGKAFKIAGHPAIASATAQDITLVDPLWEAIAAASTGTLVHHPCRAVLIHASPPTTTLVGVPIRDIPISNFGWLQTRGVCGVLQEGVVVAGSPVACSDTVDGAVTPMNVTYVVDEHVVGVAVANTATGDVAVIDLRLG